MFQLREQPFDIDFDALSRCAPARAGDLAYKLFCTPRLSFRRSADQQILVQRARYHLRDAECVSVALWHHGCVRAYVLHPEGDTARATVLIVHGWTSEASFMTAVAEPLRRSGYRVVLFDCPAHGKSYGRQASLIDCARATVIVTRFFEKQFGPIRSVVAHSMGGLASLLAASGGEPLHSSTDIRHFILISPPNRFAEIAAEFGNDISLSQKAQRIYERHLERAAHSRLSTFTVRELLLELRARALLIHSRDDSEVPIHNSYEIMNGLPGVELKEFEQLGRRKILYAPPVIRSIVEELRQADRSNASNRSLSDRQNIAPTLARSAGQSKQRA